MCRRAWMILVVVVVPLLMLHPAAYADDTDGDGLPDDVEVRLGTDPTLAEELEQIAGDDVTDVPDGVAGRYDISRISMANVARGRWLWAVEFAEPVEADDCVITLYVDADADATTGRPAMGCEVAYSFYEGIAKCSVYVDGVEAGQYSVARIAVVEGVLYICGDAPLKQFNEHSRLRIRLHSQTLQPPAVTDRFGFIEVEGPPDSDREPRSLSPNGVVRGTVVDEQGEPVPGARIIGHEMQWRHPYDPFEPAVDITADAEGRFEGEGRPGMYVWLATAGMMTSSDRSWDLRNRTMAQGSIRELTLTVAPGGAVRGTVVNNETGDPMLGARLVLGSGLTAIADGQGRFSISGVGTGEQRLMAIADGMAHRTVNFEVTPGETHEVEMDMSPGFTVAGTVTDLASNPVVGAVVRDHYSGAIMLCCLRRVYTNEEGRYELHGYSRNGDLWSMGVEHADYAKQTRSSIAPPAEGDTVTLDFVLDTGFAVAGTVLKPDGMPGVGATVQYGTNQSNVHYATTKTGGSGEFLLDKLPSNRAETIVVFCPGCAPSSRQATPAKGSAAPELTFELEEGHTAEGVVVDNDGNPIAGARVSPMACLNAEGCSSCRHGDYFGSTSTTGADGSFTLKDLPAGGVTADVGASGYSYARQHLIEVDAHTTIVLDPPGAIKGKVVDQETGAPVPAFNVRLDFSSAPREPDEPNSGGISSSLHRNGQDAQGADGTFTISGLICRAGYAAIVTAEGYAPTRVERVVAATADDDKWPVVIELGQGETLTGTVADPDGNPLADAELRLMWSERGYLHLDLGDLDGARGLGMQSRSTQTDAQGAFELAGLVEGQTYALLVRHADYAATVLREFGLAESVAIELEQPGSLVGSVAGFGEFDLSRTYINIASGGVQWDRANVAADGRFESRNLAPGEYRATIYAPMGVHDRPNPARTTEVTVKADEETRLDFAALGGATISGQVLLKDDPVSDVTVRLMLSDDYDEIAYGYSNSNGEFVLYSIPPGEFGVIADQSYSPYSVRYFASVRVTVGDEDLRQDIRFESGSITGSVTDADTGEALGKAAMRARPINGEDTWAAVVRAYCYEEPRERGMWTGLRRGAQTQSSVSASHLNSPTLHSGGRSGESTLEGAFAIHNLAGGSYLLRVQAKAGVIPGWLGPVTVATDEETTHDLTLAGGGTLSLRALDAANGEPVEGARVFVCSPDGMQLSDTRRRPLTDAEKLEQETRGSPGYKDEPITTDEQGMVVIEDTPLCEYGA